MADPKRTRLEKTTLTHIHCRRSPYPRAAIQVNDSLKSSSQAPITGRFAVLEHRWNGLHWDLFLETKPGGPLQSWAIDEPIAFERELPARKLADHRSVYLDYEGPLTGGRGVVRRIDRGVFQTEVWSESRVRARLAGDQLDGMLELRRMGESSSWTFLLGKVD